MSLIKPVNGHIFVSGITRSGKTYFSGRALAELPYPVVFFNMQDESLPDKFLTVDAKGVTGDQLIGVLRHGVKIDLRMPFTSAANVVIGYICSILMGAGFTDRNPVYLAFDECHLLDGYGLKKAIEIATRGLKRGCRAVFITQRPALADKTLYTQSTDQYIFYLSPSEAAYLKSKGIEYDKIKDDWERLGKYSYIYYDGYTYEARKAVK